MSESVNDDSLKVFEIFCFSLIYNITWVLGLLFIPEIGLVLMVIVACMELILCCFFLELHGL